MTKLKSTITGIALAVSLLATTVPASATHTACPEGQHLIKRVGANSVEMILRYEGLGYTVAPNQDVLQILRDGDLVHLVVCERVDE